MEQSHNDIARLIESAKSTTLSLKQLMEKKFEGINSLIGAGLLNQNAIMVLGGPPKSYKSFVSKSLCYHLATGTPLFGVSRSIRDKEREYSFPVSDSYKVLLLEQEIGERDLQGRFASLLSGLPPAEKTLCLEKVFIHSCDHDMQLDTPEGVRYIGTIVGDVKPHVVIIDPLIEFHTGDENSSRDMAKTLRGLDALRERFLFSTIINHHESKPQKDSQRDGPDRLRGSSVIYGKGDSFLNLIPDPRKSGRIRITFKLRRDKPISSIWVNINEENLRTTFECWHEGQKKSKFDVG